MKKQRLWIMLSALSLMPLMGSAQMCAPNTVSIASTGATMAYTCEGDGNADFIEFANMTTATANFNYIVTDDQGNIIGLPPENMVDFEGAGPGICRVYGVSYGGPLTGAIGDNIFAVDLAQQGCCILSSNFVEVVRGMPDGGNVLTVDGESMTYTCPGDGNPDLVSFMAMNSANGFRQYVVTDDQGNILGLPPANTVDFDGAGPGNCYVYYMRYTGNLIASMGDNINNDPLSDDCYDLSDDFVTVFRGTPDGGNVLTVDGESMTYTCPGDGNPDLVSFMAMNSANGFRQYVVTDDQGNILGLPPANTVDFDGAGPGNCYVYYMRYTGNLIASMGDNINNDPLSDDCYDLSDDFVTVFRGTPDGGNVLTVDGESMTYTCPGDGNPDLVSFMAMNSANGFRQYVVTDDQGNILGLPPANTVDFDGAGPGNCYVYYMRYTGNLIASMGDNINNDPLSDDCYDLSDDFVTVFRGTPDGGNVLTVDGESMTYTCPGDGNPDLVSFMAMNSANGFRQYVVTDDQGNILGLPPANTVDFDGAGPGNCYVYYMRYTGNLIASMGDNINNDPLSDDCYDLSDDFVTVFRGTPDGGNVLTTNGESFDLLPLPRRWQPGLGIVHGNELS